MLFHILAPRDRIAFLLFSRVKPLFRIIFWQEPIFLVTETSLFLFFLPTD